MTIQEAFLTPGASHGRTGQPLVPRGILVHYVGNPGSTATANRNWFENGASGTFVSAHYIIGLQGEILQMVPDDERAMHAGKSYGVQWDGMSAINNARYIGIECCHPGADGQFNDQTATSLIWLLRQLCEKHKLNPAADILRHYDVTGKSCPAYYVKHTDAWNALVAQCVTPRLTVYVNGAAQDIPARLVGGSYYTTFAALGALSAEEVPLRAALEACGFTVRWQGGAVLIDAPAAVQERG